ncbi:metal-dependent transcriptional regulator [Labilibacter marinus]|uniref:metal-dependent transcriptional regulator n=1 Tax=Labilibacter marinus TaxID=1477105 RepID=UPI00082A6652|nr:metal-dependent transcriptional regulator [Labilibacter marinus]
MNSISVENFLKNIFTLQNDEGEKASTSIMSARLGISGPAITDMAKKLSAKGLITYQPYKELELTTEGKAIAIKVIRRHRIWEMFLHQVLKMDLSEVHNEAEMLEHQTSDNLLEKMDTFLNHPKFDPHGDPIPHEDGTIQRHKNAVKMEDLKEGDNCKIVRLIYSDEEVQQLFNHYNIETNLSIKIIKVFKLDKSMDVELNEQRIHLPAAIQKRIFCQHI